MMLGLTSKVFQYCMYVLCSVEGHCHGIMRISLLLLLGNDTIDSIMNTDCFRWVGHMHNCVYCRGDYFGNMRFC